MSISATLKRKVSYENDENIKKNLKKILNRKYLKNKKKERFICHSGVSGLK